MNKETIITQAILLTILAAVIIFLVVATVIIFLVVFYETPEEKAGIKVGDNIEILEQMDGDEVLIEQLEDELTEKTKENRELTLMLEESLKEYKELKDSLNSEEVNE